MGTHSKAPTGERFARYASIPPGDYRFLVQLAGSPQTNGTPTSFSFVIARPLWRQWWLLAPILAAVVAGGYALYRRRVRKLVELERVRTRIATDLHDDIGSSLSQIAVLSEVVRQKVRRGERPASEPLSRIAEISREFVDSMDDIVWSINPQKDHVSDLVVRMRQFASDLFSSRIVPLRFSVPELHTDAKLGATVRRQVFLVFKEGLNNVIRHSGCNEARVEMRLQKALHTNANDINNYRIAAEISYWQGVWKAQRAIPAEEDVREGLAASQRALSIDTTRADVLALQGRLELLRARCTTDAATRATAARRAMEQFERAFAINPPSGASTTASMLVPPDCSGRHRPEPAAARILIERPPETLVLLPTQTLGELPRVLMRQVRRGPNAAPHWRG